MELVVFWVFVLTRACLSKIELRTESYCWHSTERSFSGFLIRSELRISEWNDSLYILLIFRNDIFSLFHFVLQQSISDMTARWSEIPAAEKTDLIELEMRLVISRSSQWPWTWVGKLPCCFRSKHVRISLNLLVFPFELSRCKLKSPNMYKLSCCEIMLSSRS